jgi:hypothetical protein
MGGRAPKPTQFGLKCDGPMLISFEIQWDQVLKVDDNDPLIEMIDDQQACMETTPRLGELSVE